MWESNSDFSMLKPVYEKVENRKLTEMYLRDPFLFTDRERKCYFLYGTNMNTCDGAANLDPFFETWISRDLQTFQGPYLVFQPERGFWGVKHYGLRKYMPIMGRTICLRHSKVESERTVVRLY